MPPGQQQPQGHGSMNPSAGSNTAPPTPGGGNAPGLLNANAGHGGPGPQSAPPQMQAPQDMFSAGMLDGDFGGFGSLDGSMFQNDGMGGLGSVDFTADFSDWLSDPTLMGGDKM